MFVNRAEKQTAGRGNGRSSLDEVEKSEGQGLVAGGGWVVRETARKGGGRQREEEGQQKEKGKEKR